MTEEMIAQLGQIDPDRMSVIVRTSVMHHKGSSEPLPQIGSELGIQYVLEGSVRRDSGRVRITVRQMRQDVNEFVHPLPPALESRLS